jgi:hypothetical protein
VSQAEKKKATFVPNSTKQFRHSLKRGEVAVINKKQIA